MNNNYICNLFLAVLFAVFTCNAFALSATTALTIQGSRPNLISPITHLPLTSSNVADIVHFKAPDGTLYYGDNTTVTTTLPNKYFSETLKFTQFTSNEWSTISFYDNDGDTKNTNAAITTQPGETINPTYPFIGYDSIAMTWKDKDNNSVSYSNTDTLDPCQSPYTLTVTYTKLRVRSLYGDPAVAILDNELNNNNPISQDFTINTVGICWLKPGNSLWAGWVPKVGGGETYQDKGGTLTPSQNYNFGGGYDTNQYDPNKGFKTNLSTRFPTTGFAGAYFTIDTSDLPVNYNFTVTDKHGNSTNVIAIPSSPGNRVNFINKPTAFPLGLKIKGSAAGYPDITYEFEIENWATILSTSQANQADANTACLGAGTTGLFIRSELTNSPLSSPSMDPINWSNVTNNIFTRQVGTFSGEWGRMRKSDTYGSYASSDWITGFHWTSEYDTGKSVALLYSPYYGRVNYLGGSDANPNPPANNPIYTVCKN